MEESHNSYGHIEDQQAVKAEIWDRAFYATATAAIFGYRAEVLKRRLRLLTFVALVVPIAVGGLALAYGAGFRYLSVAVGIGAAIGVLQLVISLWSVIALWVEEYGYSITSLVENQRLARDLEGLAKAPLMDSRALWHRYELLKVMDDARQDQDYGHAITDEEKRRGHRAALRERARKCNGCGEVPTTMEPSGCGVCGNFKNRRI